MSNELASLYVDKNKKMELLPDDILYIKYFSKKKKNNKGFIVFDENDYSKKYSNEEIEKNKNYLTSYYQNYKW